MAIIGGASGLEAVILEASRPALLIKSGKVADEVSPEWRGILNTNRALVERAILGTARLEASDKALPYIGTAFGVAPRLAITTKWIGLAVRDGQLRQPPTSYWLNFKAELGSDETFNVPISQVMLLHPTLDVALVDLESDLAPERILSLSPVQPRPDTRIAVIGYPSFDVRNDRDLQSVLFGSRYGFKRLMPGKVMEDSVTPSFGRQVISLTHDATTLGGTAGAPIIDLENGRVVAVNFAGQYGVANFGVPAKNLSKLLDALRADDLDLPHAVSSDEALSSLADSSKNASAISAAMSDNGALADRKKTPRKPPPRRTKPRPFKIFTFDQIARLHEELIDTGFVEDEDLRILSAEMPLEFQATLPGGRTASAKLLARLQFLNRYVKLFEVENHLPFYLLLRTAQTLRRGQPQVVATLQPYLESVLKAEDQAKRQQKP